MFHKLIICINMYKYVYIYTHTPKKTSNNNGAILGAGNSAFLTDIIFRVLNRGDLRSSRCNSCCQVALNPQGNSFFQVLFLGWELLLPYKKEKSSQLLFFEKTSCMSFVGGSFMERKKVESFPHPTMSTSPPAPFGPQLIGER